MVIYLQNVGFTLRATCINPVLYYDAPGCVSYPFFQVWDPDFVNDIGFSRVYMHISVCCYYILGWWSNFMVQYCRPR